MGAAPSADLARSLQSIPTAGLRRYGGRRNCCSAFCFVLCPLWYLSTLVWLLRPLWLDLPSCIITIVASVLRACAAACFDRRYTSTKSSWCDDKHVGPSTALPPPPRPSTLSTNLRACHSSVHLNFSPADGVDPTLLLPGDLLLGRLVPGAGYERAYLACVERLHVYSGGKSKWSEWTQSIEHYNVPVVIRASGDFSVVIPDNGAPPTFAHPIDGFSPTFYAHGTYVAHISHELVFHRPRGSPLRIPLVVAASSRAPPTFLEPFTAAQHIEFPTHGSINAKLRLPHRVALRPSNRSEGWFLPEVAVALEGVHPRSPPFMQLHCIVEITAGFDGAWCQRGRIFSLFKLPIPHLGAPGGAAPAGGAQATRMTVGIPDSAHTWSTRRWCELPLPLPPSFTSKFFRVAYQLDFHPARLGIAAPTSDDYSFLELHVTNNALALPQSQVAIALGAPSPAAAPAPAAVAADGAAGAAGGLDAAV